MYVIFVATLVVWLGVANCSLTLNSQTGGKLKLQAGLCSCQEQADMYSVIDTYIVKQVVTTTEGDSDTVQACVCIDQENLS